MNAQLSRVTRDSMVLVVSQHNLPKPGTDLARTMMLPALKLSLNGFQLRDHPLLRRDSPDDESTADEPVGTRLGLRETRPRQR